MYQVHRACHCPPRPGVHDTRSARWCECYVLSLTWCKLTSMSATWFAQQAIVHASTFTWSNGTLWCLAKMNCEVCGATKRLTWTAMHTPCMYINCWPHCSPSILRIYFALLNFVLFICLIGTPWIVWLALIISQVLCVCNLQMNCSASSRRFDWL